MKLHFATSCAVVLGLTVTMVAFAGRAQAEEWNLCTWQEIPKGVMDRIERRDDFGDILKRMFDACPDSALALTDRPTASISSGQGERVNGNDRTGFGPPAGLVSRDTPPDETTQTEVPLPG